MDWQRFSNPLAVRIRSNSAKRKKPEKQHDLHFAGYDFTSGPSGTIVPRQVVDTSKGGDYGRDPLGDGTFRMVPSGDIVDYEESRRRLGR